MSRALTAALAALSLACGASSSGGAQGASGRAPLISTSAVPPGAACAAGGRRIATGADANGNGVLEPSEVSSSAVVCDGTQGTPGGPGGPAAVTLVEALDAGSPCAAGGSGFASGIDTSRDGALQASERTAVAWACDGARGAAGLTQLARLVEEPPGEHCPGGGTAVWTGLDASRDLVLDAGEVRDVEYACGAGVWLVAFEALPPGPQCAAGGQAIRTGFDRDGDATLDAAEVARTDSACSGLLGHASLVESAPEPAGARCGAPAGVALSFGLDGNGDGRLTGAEVARVELVCEGMVPSAPHGAVVTVATAAEPAGASCPFGGQRVDSGLDADRDGVLAAAEVARTVYACDAPAIVLSPADEPPGAACPFGGRAWRRGHDFDRDGALDAAEVAATDYVCDGAPGLQSLVHVEPMAGEPCAETGNAVRAGVDRNSDGMLGIEEVESESFVCDDSGDALVSLVRREDELPGGRCGEFGGIAILTGLDLSRDGWLDDDEVRQDTVVCNGAPLTATHLPLVERVPEPGGANCSGGGELLRSGLDVDDDQVLDEEEVSSEAYLCGSTGRALRASSAQWGGVCTRGGVKVESGGDADGDGVLADAEVDPAATTWLCNRWVAAVASGQRHACALVSDGGVRCWGSNASGQVGHRRADGTVATEHLTPVEVTGLAGATAITAGTSHSCAILADATVWCWGANAAGQLGDGTKVNAPVPVMVALGPDEPLYASAVTAGDRHTCAMDYMMGDVKCWGTNSLGQLGGGPPGPDRTTPGSVIVGFDTSTTPSMPVPLLDAASVTTGPTANHTCAVLWDTTLRCWGAGNNGQIGDGGTGSRPVATLVKAVQGPGVPVTAILDDVRAVAVGPTHTCAVRYDTVCWGDNTYGQLGDGTSGTDRGTPVQVIGGDGPLVNQAALAAGGDGFGVGHTCAVSIGDGAVRCWGRNADGQLGVGTGVATSLEPLEVGSLTDVRALSAGSVTTCAATGAGPLWCWGSGAWGQLGDGTKNRRPVPVQVGGMLP